jgi:hypothetical protein
MRNKALNKKTLDVMMIKKWQKSQWKPAAACPINGRLVDENRGRIVSLLTFVFLAGFVVFQKEWMLWLLLAEFSVRSFQRYCWSPMCRSAELLQKVFRIPVRKVNAAPKEFAQKVGLVFSLLLAVSYFAGWSAVFYGAGVFFALCVFFEFSLGFCVACKLYPWWRMLSIKEKVGV